jgi:hypothetical protein
MHDLLICKLPLVDGMAKAVGRMLHDPDARGPIALERARAMLLRDVAA